MEADKVEREKCTVQAIGNSAISEYKQDEAALIMSHVRVMLHLPQE
jgi:hypothetical protein